MIKLLPLILFLNLFHNVSFAQVKTKVTHNDKDVKVSEDTVPNLIRSQLKVAHDTIEQNVNAQRAIGVNQKEEVETRIGANKVARKQKEISDSLASLSDKFNSETGLQYRQVYSEKIIKKVYDSLGISTLSHLPLKEISKDEFIDLINEKFSSQASSYYSDTLSSKLPLESDLSSHKLSQTALSELTPISGLVMNSRYIAKLDSIRKINLREQGLALEERLVSTTSKVSVIKEKLSFWDKTYFEGIVGLSSIQDPLLVQLSPSFAYHFTQRFSLGMGPVVHILKNESEGAFATVGFRPYIKQEFFKRKVYLQAEYVMNPGLKNTEQLAINRHNVLTGGGVLIALSSSISINIALLYQWSESNNDSDRLSPWVLRIGISSTKTKK